MDTNNKNVTEKAIESQIANYRRIQPKYASLCEETKRIITESFPSSDIYTHTIEARAKSIESFSKKAARRSADGELRYIDAIREITDLAGVRIITYTLHDVSKVCRFVEDNFSIIEKKDIGEERFRAGKFGYQSIHYLIKFSDERVSLPDSRKYKGLVCEIQVRTVLQHAWAEIEHDIQYKNQSDLPRSLQRKFIALAGLLEVADREFQSIQDEDRRLKSLIRESLQEDLTRAAIAEKSGPRNDSNKNEDSDLSQTSVRQLVKAGRFSEAIELYDTKIEAAPAMHTLYLGRAKASFLNGDSAGALKDIETALTLNADDPIAESLRNQILEGDSDQARPVSTEGNALTAQANELLMQGDGVSAFEYYSRAQDEGSSRPFSIFNKSMSCILASDIEGAKYTISTLEIRNGTPMAVNIVAMYCIIYALTDESKYEEEIVTLKQLLGKMSEYSFTLSPLSKLEIGIKNSKLDFNNQNHSRILKIFELLKGEAD
ncbi:hypothetical protein [Oricola indica]|uniref:GTP pyrophosphokinase n=1 Tax=Oricola indica TaxID=2872591 RepID=UPI003CCB817C